jgi:hypothetical protein
MHHQRLVVASLVRFSRVTRLAIWWSPSRLGAAREALLLEQNEKNSTVRDGEKDKAKVEM